jgi:hypothetical protein
MMRLGLIGLFAEIGDVDTAATVLTPAGDALAVVSNARYNARGYDVRMEVHGSADSVAAGLEDRWPIRSASLKEHRPVALAEVPLQEVSS